MEGNYDGIICISNVDWDGLYQRHQYIMNGIDFHNTILFINNFGLRDIKVNRDISKVINKLKNRFSSKSSFVKNYKRKNIQVIDIDIIPVHSKESFRRVNALLLHKAIQKQVERLNFKNYILWIYNPGEIVSRSIDELNPALVIYDCVDDFASFNGVPSDIEESEIKVIEKSDVVFTTSLALFKDKSKYNKNCFYVPNGFDKKAFMEVEKFDISELDRIKARGKKLVGFVGAIHQWVDLDLVYKCAAMRKDYDFVMVGPIDSIESVEEFKTLDNVFFLGRQDKQKVPYIVSNFQAAIIPFKVNKLTESVNPLKLYEYFALKKNVVTTPFADFGEFNEYVFIAGESERFVLSIDEAIQKPFNNRITEQLNRYTWENICKDIKRIIDEQ